MVFERNVLRRLGGGGVSFTAGTGAIVRGNVVTDVSSTGITIGDAVTWTSPSVYDTGATVSNNVVRGVAAEYLGGVGIFAGWVKHTRITHNEVSDLPFIGISLGWGWNHASDMVDNHIDGNLVQNVHGSSLFDGGAIYVLGAQGASPGSTISSNFVSGDAQPYGAIYLDAGSSHWTVRDNVVEKAPYGWLYLQHMDNATSSSNLVESNYSDTDTQQAAPEGSQRDQHGRRQPAQAHKLAGCRAGHHRRRRPRAGIRRHRVRCAARTEELEKQVFERTSSLHEANIDLQHSNKNLEQFAYIASHDLQEPLRKIITFSLMLQDKFKSDLPEAANALVAKIGISSNRMSTLLKTC